MEWQGRIRITITLVTPMRPTSVVDARRTLAAGRGPARPGKSNSRQREWPEGDTWTWTNRRGRGPGEEWRGSPAPQGVPKGRGGAAGESQQRGPPPSRWRHMARHREVKPSAGSAAGRGSWGSTIISIPYPQTAQSGWMDNEQSRHADGHTHSTNLPEDRWEGRVGD